MGLNTSHNCWNGPYSSFNEFRHLLAAQIGINLNEYAGYDQGGTKDLTTINHGLMAFFNHSDCDGDLTVEQSARIVDGFNNVLENFNDKIKSYPGFKDDIIQFRDGLLDVISKNEVVYFH